METRSDSGPAAPPPADEAGAAGWPPPVFGPTKQPEAGSAAPVGEPVQEAARAGLAAGPVPATVGREPDEPRAVAGHDVSGPTPVSAPAGRQAEGGETNGAPRQTLAAGLLPQPPTNSAPDLEAVVEDRIEALLRRKVEDGDLIDRRELGEFLQRMQREEMTETLF